MADYHNEFDPYAAQWIRNLIAAGHLPPGDVDERSIADVSADDLRGYTRCHFFAGLGGWPFALRQAGWPDDRPVWTGSCPCQPGSVAGLQGGFDDPRHLWPTWRGLIAERRPAAIFGEQVAGWADWLRLVRGDLEEMDYAVGAMPIEAASAGAEHFRDRYWFVANNDLEGQGQGQGWLQRGGEQRWSGGCARDRLEPLADSDSERSQIPVGQSSDIGAECTPAEGSGVRLMVDAESVGWGEGWTESELRSRGFTASVASIDGCQYIECPDGKWRRLPPPRVRWLGTRIPSRVAMLRALGNSIDWRPAAAFIAAAMECIPD